MKRVWDIERGGEGGIKRRGGEGGEVETKVRNLYILVGRAAAVAIQITRTITITNIISTSKLSTSTFLVTKGGMGVGNLMLP